MTKNLNKIMEVVDECYVEGCKAYDTTARKEIKELNNLIYSEVGKREPWKDDVKKFGKAFAPPIIKQIK